MKRLIVAVVTALLLSAIGVAHAVQPDEILANPAQEQRARDLGRELRCLVCQNQSIDDSEADLARDLRVLVRNRIRAGDTDAEVLAYVQARYGDFVLLRPPVKPETWLLWFGPIGFALIGGAVVWLYLRRRQFPATEPAPLTDAERRRLDRLIEGTDR